MMESDNSPTKSPKADLSSNVKRKRERRIVKVLNLIESAKSGQEKYIKFTQRLHPWTTIKVRFLFKIFMVILLFDIAFFNGRGYNVYWPPPQKIIHSLLFLATEINNSLNYGIPRAQIKIIFR